MEDPQHVTVDVSTELLARMRAELGGWSDPVQVRIIETPGYGTGYEMQFRTVPPTQADVEREA